MVDGVRTSQLNRQSQVYTSKKVVPEGVVIRESKVTPFEPIGKKSVKHQKE